MNGSNVERIRALYEAFKKGDIETVLGAFDTGIVWNEAENFIYADGNPYVGMNALVEGIFMRLGSEWENFVATPEEIHDAGGTVVASGWYTGTYRKTGKSVRAQFAHFWTLSNGKITRFQQYTDTAQFAQAVKG